MRRHRFALTLMALLAGGLVLTLPAPSLALTSQTYSISVEVGAARTLPSGSFAYNDVCDVGYNGGSESRCAVEFNLSGILSSAKLFRAQLTFNKTAGCATQDCPVDLFLFTGNGSADLADVTGGTFDRDFTPGFAGMQFDILTELQDRVTNGDDYLGVRLSRSSKSTRNPDIQTFGYSSFKLDLSFIQRPVDVTVHLAGLGDGTVTSNPFGIDCGQACTGTFEWLEPLTLTATPQNGGFFSHWEGGACDGSPDPVCSFDTPATDPDITAFFDPPIGPPISQPPAPTPAPTPTQLTPPPLPTSRPSSGPLPTGGPLPTVVAPTDIIASDGTVITPAPTQAAVASGAAPTIVGLGDDAADAGASGGIPLALVIVLILLLGGGVGAGVYWYSKRQQAAGP